MLLDQLTAFDPEASTKLVTICWKCSARSIKPQPRTISAKLQSRASCCRSLPASRRTARTLRPACSATVVMPIPADKALRASNSLLRFSSSFTGLRHQAGTGNSKSSRHRSVSMPNIRFLSLRLYEHRIFGSYTSPIRCLATSVTSSHIPSSASSCQPMSPTLTHFSWTRSILCRERSNSRSKIKIAPRPSSLNFSINAQYAAASGERVNDTLGLPG